MEAVTCVKRYMGSREKKCLGRSMNGYVFAYVHSYLCEQVLKIDVEDMKMDR